MKLKVFALLLLLGTPALAEKSVQDIGFNCTSVTGATRKFNIDLKRRRYNAGEGVKLLDGVTDTKIILEAQNPYLMGDNGGLGPILHSLELNRVSLILTDQTIMPNKGTNRRTNYQCVMVTAIDFTVGRKF